jgi:hypothetical protein
MKRSTVEVKATWLMGWMILFITGQALAECIPIKLVANGVYYIKKPGVYCFTKNLEGGYMFSPPFDTIRIEANNVILDLQGYTLKGPSWTGYP